MGRGGRETAPTFSYYSKLPCELRHSHVWRRPPPPVVFHEGGNEPQRSYPERGGQEIQFHTLMRPFLPRARGAQNPKPRAASCPEGESRFVKEKVSEGNLN